MARQKPPERVTSRERILSAVSQNKPAQSPLPTIPVSTTFTDHVVDRFSQALANVGGLIVPVDGLAAVADYIQAHYPLPHRVVTTLPELAGVADKVVWYGPESGETLPHQLADVELAVLRVHFGVAENGAVWLTEPLLGHRAAPFICQHLAVVLSGAGIVPTMHEAYDRIGTTDYNFGLFIAGPSKTADIEQSLVLGAHGPMTMTVFLLP